MTCDFVLNDLQIDKQEEKVGYNLKQLSITKMFQILLFLIFQKLVHLI
jgi:hypothetical protein